MSETDVERKGGLVATALNQDSGDPGSLSTYVSVFPICIMGIILPQLVRELRVDSLMLVKDSDTIMGVTWSIWYFSFD